MNHVVPILYSDTFIFAICLFCQFDKIIVSEIISCFYFNRIFLSLSSNFNTNLLLYKYQLKAKQDNKALGIAVAKTFVVSRPYLDFTLISESVLHERNNFGWNIVELFLKASKIGFPYQN